MFGIIFIVIIIIPLAVTFGGFILKQCSDSDVDSTVGYRTRRSMASKEAWKLANETCAKLWITGGIITTVLSVVLPFTACLILNETAGLYIGVFVLLFQITAFILSVVTVENKLKLQEKNK